MDHTGMPNMTKAATIFVAGLLALAVHQPAIAQSDDGYIRPNDTADNYFYIPPAYESQGSFDIGLVTHDAEKLRGIDSGIGIGMALLSDIELFSILRAAPGDRTGPDLTLGGTTSLRPFVGAEFFRYETDKSINFNQPGGLNQILDNAYSGMLRAGLEADVVVTERVSAFGSIAGGVDLRWGNLVLNSQGFNPNQTQRIISNPTEFYTGGLFRAGGGLRFRLRGGTVGLGVFGQTTNTSFVTGSRSLEKSVLLMLTWRPGRTVRDRSFDSPSDLQIMNMPRIIIEEEEEERIGQHVAEPGMRY